MRRRTTRRAALCAAGAILVAATGCDLSRTTDEETSTMTDDRPATAEEALEEIGVAAPDTPLTLSDGIVVSDLDEWSVRVSFSEDAQAVDHWLHEAFDGAEGLPVTSDGATISQRFAPEEVEQGARYLDGSDPSDPSAVYTVLISPAGTDVIVAAARTSR